jgi:hypothetical protein
MVLAITGSLQGEEHTAECSQDLPWTQRAARFAFGKGPQSPRQAQETCAAYDLA